MLINATSHKLNFCLADGTKVALDPSGLEPEVQFKKAEIGKVSLYQFLVPVNETEILDQNNLLVPAELIRDDRGRVVGCKSLAKV